MKAESNDKKYKYIERAVASSLTELYIFAKTGDFAGWGQAEEPCSILPNGSYVGVFLGIIDSFSYHLWSYIHTVPLNHSASLIPVLSNITTSCPYPDQTMTLVEFA